MKKIWTLPAISLLVAPFLSPGTSSALPPNSPAALRDGANHHTGDDGFVERLGRKPGPKDEKLRMHEHFIAVRDRLAARKATRPDLEAKRQKILKFLDAYIARGTTPENDHLPWRTPVFIDDKGTICAVGYLIEQTAGRPLADKIASSHRYSFIEDIAKDMPEVRAWVAESGFTLDELGQIQPGYPGPDVLLWQSGEFVDAEDSSKKITNGAVVAGNLRGAMLRGKMEGAWTRTAENGAVLGAGVFHRGAGSWTSYFESGTKQAEGGYANNRPNGAWRFYHESGNLAAEGSFAGGQRVGMWRFYYDTAARTPIATGRFAASGYVSGKWRHFDANGKLLVTTVVDTPETWVGRKTLFWNVGYRLDVVPGADGIQHQIHTGNVDEGNTRLDMLTFGRTRIFTSGDDVFDSSGHRLVRDDERGTWRSDDCHWSPAMKTFARRGDVSALNGLMHRGYSYEAPACTEGSAIPAARAARVAKLVDSMSGVRSATPEFMTKVALEEDGAKAEDLPDALAASMSLDITWPHVDGRFNTVYETLPGYSRS